FVLCLLYFWADMSGSAFAAKRLPGASLGLAILFVWMKVLQACFAAGFRARCANRPPPPLNPRTLLAIAFLQGVVQPTGFILLPLASLVMLPAAWCYAFYQCILIPTPAEAGDLSTLIGRASNQARLWPRQNHVALGVLTVVALAVYMNLTVGLTFAPFLLKQLTGIETVFTRSSYYTLNSTLLAVAVAGTYLLVDPLVKALYALRCHYGESLHTAEDLRADLRRCRASRVAPLIALAALLATGAAGAVEAEQPRSVAPQEIDNAVSRTLTQRKFAWRFPRTGQDEEAERGIFGTFLDEVVATMKRWVAAVADAVNTALDWLRSLFPERVPRPARGATGTLGWLGTTHALIFVLLALAASAVVILLWRRWRKRRTPEVEAIEAAALPMPDLTEEFIRADERPSDEWLNLASDLVAKGDYRLALRAVYLASLAMLARHSMITIAKYKSNLDYQHELSRRGHAIPDVHALFSQNVQTFDRVWYGMHPAAEGDISPFISAVQQMEEHVARQ
ncbi:MAG: hypothetical protein HN976_09380, partial [Lentisphaerae bacterium]|nr:hypothetical protein [Lentisphaerota bacterium]